MEPPNSNMLSDFSARFANLLPTPFLILDISRSVLFFNTRAQKMLGVPRKKSGFVIDDFLSDTDVQRLSASIDLLSSKSKSSVEFVRIIRTGKSSFWNIFLEKPSKRSPHIFAFFLEPSSPQSLIETIPITKELLMHIIEDSHDGLLILNNDSVVEYVSSKLLKTLKLKRRDLLHNRIDTVFPDEMQAHLADVAQHDGPTSTTFRMTFPLGNASTVILDISINKFVSSIIGSVILIHFHDITEEIIHEKQLYETRLQNELLIETVNDGIVIDDENSEIVFVNNALCSMTGYEQDELIGRKYYEFLLDMSEDAAQKILADRKQGVSGRYESQWRTKSGDIIYTIVSATPYFDPTGKFMGTIAVITDITELKLSKKAADFYLSLLTHDIANQLHIILTAAGMLDFEESTPFVTSAHDNIINAVQRCNKLIAKVKRASKISELPLEPVDIVQVVKEKIGAIKRTFGVKTHVRSLEGPIYVNANILLGELIWNLLENAARHNPKKTKHVWVSGRRKSSMFGLTIADNGPGMSDSMKQNLFDHPEQHGGVGLTLIAQITRKYGGHLEVRDRIADRPELGVKITLWLHLAKS